MAVDPRAESFFWANVRAMLEEMENDSPDGHVARIDVHLHGGETFTPRYMKSIPPWLFFETRDEDGHARLLVLRYDRIAQIELHFVRAGADEQAIGFRVDLPGEPSAAAEPPG